MISFLGFRQPTDISCIPINHRDATVSKVVGLYAGLRAKLYPIALVNRHFVDLAPVVFKVIPSFLVSFLPDLSRAAIKSQKQADSASSAQSPAMSKNVELPSRTIDTFKTT